MKPVSVLVLALLFSSSLYASNHGYLSMCIDKYVPNSSTQKQIYHFKVDDEKSKCMHYGKYAEFIVEIPPHAKPRLYCDDHEEEIATETWMHLKTLISGSVLQEKEGEHLQRPQANYTSMDPQITMKHTLQMM